jgi:hypothetical protein
MSRATATLSGYTVTLEDFHRLAIAITISLLLVLLSQAVGVPTLLSFSSTRSPLAKTLAATHPT